MQSLVSRHLGNFLVLYDTLNMHVAAEKKNISQPALTKSLRVLEKELAVDLFVRTAKGLEPTEEGTALYGYVQAIDQEARFAAMDIRARTSDLDGNLRMGIGSALAANWFATVLGGFHRDYPNIKIKVETGISSHLTDLLIRGHCDLVVAARPEQDLPEQFARIPLFRCQMHAICRSNHPLCTPRPVSVEELVTFGRIGFVEDREFERHAYGLFRRHIDGLRPIVETSSLSIMLGLLATTDHFAIISETMLPRAHQQGLALLPTAEALWQIDIDLMCKERFSSSRPISAIRSLLLDQADNW